MATLGKNRPPIGAEALWCRGADECLDWYKIEFRSCPTTTLLMDRLHQGVRLAASEIGIAVVVRDDKMSTNCQL
jgi:hypothetical protein